jgi:hypothetical protein
MKVISVPKYLTPYGVIEFEPKLGVPGYTHRVRANGEPLPLWVPEGQNVAAKSTAEFYVRVWRALAEGKSKHYYVDRNEDPPSPESAVPVIATDHESQAATSEAVIALPNGQELRCPAFPAPCEYVRITANGEELLYWDCAEWGLDPRGVMGAIFGAAVGRAQDILSGDHASPELHP